MAGGMGQTIGGTRPCPRTSNHPGASAEWPGSRRAEGRTGLVGEEWLLTELNERIRDVIVGPDGALYLATDNDNGRVIRVAPK